MQSLKGVWSAKSMVLWSSFLSNCCVQSPANCSISPPGRSCREIGGSMVAPSARQRGVRTNTSRHHSRHLARVRLEMPNRDRNLSCWAFLAFPGCRTEISSTLVIAYRLLPKNRTEGGVTRFRQVSQQKLCRCTEMGAFPDSPRISRGKWVLWSLPLQAPFRLSFFRQLQIHGCHCDQPFCVLCQM